MRHEVMGHLATFELLRKILKREKQLDQDLKPLVEDVLKVHLPLLLWNLAAKAAADIWVSGGRFSIFAKCNR
jgi:hypothetical protein